MGSITALPLHSPLLTGEKSAADGAASPLPPESAGLKRKSKIALGQTFLLSTRLFTLPQREGGKIW